jgi:glucokinase
MSSVIGVDVGGTKVVVAPLRGNGLGESVLGPTDRCGSRALIDQIVAMVNRIRGDDLESVGIGVPSTVEFETGRVVSSVNIPLVDVPLRQVLGNRLGVPCSWTTTPPSPRWPRRTTTTCSSSPTTW